MKIRVSDVVDKDPCWSEDHVAKWAQDQGLGAGGNIIDIIRNPELATVEKMWLTINFRVLPDTTMHIMAVRFAEHVLPRLQAAPMSHAALAAKVGWLAGDIDRDSLRSFELKAWEEARYMPVCAAAAFAAKADPVVALRGSASRAGGWFGVHIKPEERMWQRERLMEALDEVQALGRGRGEDVAEESGGPVRARPGSEGEVGDGGDNHPARPPAYPGVPKVDAKDTRCDHEGGGSHDGLGAVLSSMTGKGNSMNLDVPPGYDDEYEEVEDLLDG